MKKGIILAALLASVSALGFSQTAWAVTDTASWIAAVNGIRAAGNNKSHVINVSGNVSIPPVTTDKDLPFGELKGLTVTIQGGGTLSPSNNGSVLRIPKEQTIIVRNITLRGRENNGFFAVVYVDGGTFRMEDGSVITGNKGYNGGGVESYGTFIMNGGRITGNEGSYGGGVYNRGDFTMNGGTISGNKGSGVYISWGSFTMTGGAISDNEGDGVRMLMYTNEFTMKGGTISGNSGSGVIVGGGGSFTMQGGTISGNAGRGVDVPTGNNRFIKTGGTIYGRDAAANERNGTDDRFSSRYDGKGYAVYDSYEKRWRSITAGPNMNTDTYGFWLND